MHGDGCTPWESSSKLLNYTFELAVFLFVIVVKYMYHKPSHFNYFWMYSFVALSTFTLLWNHGHHSSLEHVPLLPMKLQPSNTNSSFLLLPTPSSHHFTHRLYNLTILGTSCRWNHTIVALLWLAIFTWQNVFKVHPYYRFVKILFLIKTE
jgi:hypothetical protein